MVPMTLSRNKRLPPLLPSSLMTLIGREGSVHAMPQGVRPAFSDETGALRTVVAS